jgi:hypothetical protein
MRLLPLFLLFFLLTPSVSLADAILLAEFDPTRLFGTRCTGCAGIFDIRSGGGIDTGPAVFLFGENPDGSLGFHISPGTTGTFDFDGSNARGFDQFTARLTDSLDGHLVFHFDGITVNDRVVQGESVAFGGLLTGDTIDFLRLIVEDHEPFSLSARWQVWGEGIPISVPAPGTLALFGIGLSALTIGHGRTKTRNPFSYAVQMA